MTILNDILLYNQQFVDNQEYVPYQTSKYPDKKIIILSCMDTRLTELLPRALNLRNGDAKIIQNAGAVISHPFGSIMRSIIVGIYELKAEEIFVIGHYGCGMQNLKATQVIAKMIDRGVSRQIINTLNNSGISLEEWLQGFADVKSSVKDNVTKIRNHPLIPPDVLVHGLIIDPQTGKLNVVVEEKTLL